MASNAGPTARRVSRIACSFSWANEKRLATTEGNRHDQEPKSGEDGAENPHGETNLLRTLRCLVGEH